LSTK
jgi:hypothetical protein